MPKTPPAKPTAERRAHPRHEKKAEVHGAPQAGGTAARMITSDLSVGGLHCVSKSDFPEMTRLAVRLMLPERTNGAERTESLDLEAVVVRRQEFQSSDGDPHYELALFFTHVEKADRERIARFLGS